MQVEKAIILVAGLGTRFLPLSKVLPKELWPLVDKPVVQYLVEEAKDSGIKQIIFVADPHKQAILDYFKKSPRIEKILKQRKKNSLLVELESLQEIQREVSMSVVFQKSPLGDGHAILQAEPKVKSRPCAVLFNDDIVESEPPCLLQLMSVFESCQKPVIALHRLPKEKISSYGVVGVEKIANRVFKIKKIVEKPSIEEAPSDLAIAGKYILTPEVFDFLKKQQVDEKGEIILAKTLEKMLSKGKVIYGYEFKGKWLECGNKSKWLKSHLYFSLKDPRFGKELKEYLKEVI